MSPPVKVGDRIVVRGVRYPACDKCPKPGDIREVAELRDDGAVRVDNVGGDHHYYSIVTRWELAPEPAPEPEPYMPAEGDRVRLRGTEITGVVDFVRGDGTRLVNCGDGESVVVLPHRLERLPEPETPEWWPPQQGDLVLIEDGPLIDAPFPLMRRRKRWTTDYGVRWSDDEVLGTWRTGVVELHIRDGKPVGGAS